MADAPVVTVAVPSFNQGRFLDAALASIFSPGATGMATLRQYDRAISGASIRALKFPACFS